MTPTLKQNIAQQLETKNPFRMHKFNVFWENVKTASHLSEDQRVQLFVDLLAHDKAEIELKHLKGEGGDADGEIEARLRHSFVDIMKKFNLRNHLTPELKSQFAKTEEKNHFDQRMKQNDKEEAKKLKSRASGAANDKVASLLKQAEESKDFGAEELKDLKEELRHFSERQEERDLLMRGNEQEDWEAEGKQNAKQKNKKKKLGADGTFDDQLTIERSKIGKMEGFHHSRVRTLWEGAQRSSFSPEELEELREELKHLEVKLLKHDSVHEQATLLKSETANGCGGDKLYREIEAKRDEMARGIKSMETYFEDKIAAMKMEL